MPWQETSPVYRRERFIHDHRLDLYTMAELCARYGVSRKTGYKWRDRFEEEGRPGLRDRSRAPHQCPHRITPEVAAVICAARRQHPSWGPAKLLAWLRPRQPALDWPAVSTAGDLLARRGLVKKRRRRRHYQHPGVVPPTTTQPNDLWTADFKATSGPAMGSTATRSEVSTCRPTARFSRSRGAKRNASRLEAVVGRRTILCSMWIVTAVGARVAG